MFSVLVIQIVLRTIFSLIWDCSLAKKKKTKKLHYFLSLYLCVFMFFSFFFPFPLPLPVLHFFSSLSNSSLWPCLRDSFLLLQLRQTLHAAEFRGNYSHPWRLCRLPHKTKTKIFQQQVAAWVSTCELPTCEQPTLGNLAYYFSPANYSFSSPTLQLPRDGFPKLQRSRSNRYNSLSEGYALKSYFSLPI